MPNTETTIRLVEAALHATLRKSDIAKDLLAGDFHKETIESIADKMAKAFDKGWPGGYAQALSVENNLPDYRQECKEAFKRVVIRLLQEEASKRN